VGVNRDPDVLCSAGIWVTTQVQLALHYFNASLYRALNMEITAFGTDIHAMISSIFIRVS
jgi:hypothetical protein